MTYHLEIVVVVAVVVVVVNTTSSIKITPATIWEIEQQLLLQASTNEVVVEGMVREEGCCYLSLSRNQYIGEFQQGNYEIGHNEIHSNLLEIICRLSISTLE